MGMYSDWQGGCAMRRSKRSYSLLAGILAVAMVVSVTGLFGASGTTVRITSPASGARVSGSVDIQVSIKTTADVSYVLFGIDGTRPYSTNSPDSNMKGIYALGLGHICHCHSRFHCCVW